MSHRRCRTYGQRKKEEKGEEAGRKKEGIIFKHASNPIIGVIDIQF